MALSLANLSNEDLIRIAIESGDTKHIKRVRKSGYHVRQASALETIWPAVTTRSWKKPSDAAELVTVSSNSDQDKAGGTGVSKAYIDGLDANAARLAALMV